LETGWRNRRRIDGSGRTGSVRPPGLVLGFLLHLQVVLNCKSAEDLSGPNTCDFLIQSAGDGPVKAQVAAVNYDADWLGRIDGIATEHRIAINCAQRTDPDSVVKDRNGRNFDVIDDFFYASCGVD